MFCRHEGIERLGEPGPEVGVLDPVGAAHVHQDHGHQVHELLPLGLAEKVQDSMCGSGQIGSSIQKKICKNAI